MGRSKNRGEANARYIQRGLAGEKRCRVCHVWKPLPDFVVDRTRFDGRGYVCEDCRAMRRAAPGPSVIERRRRRALGEAWCGGCHSWLAVGAIHAGRCRPCANAAARELYTRDGDFRRRRRGRAYARRRRIGMVPIVGQDMLLEEFDGRCAYCPALATSWDHVVPVSRGGLTEPYNVVPACLPCNSSKRTRNVWDWLEATGREPHPCFVDRLMLYHAGLFPAQGPDPFE